MAKLTYISSEIKNFLPFGNQRTELVLDQHKLTSVTAENGSGKTALTIDAIFFGLFGETYRDLKKDQIVNSINMKDCNTKTVFMSNQDKVEIVRSINPDVFNVFVNGVSMWDDLKRLDRQKALEKFLNVDKRTIENQVLISESAVPFMQMDGPTRKDFVEKMLNIGVFNEIHRETKEEIKSIKPKVAEKEIELRSKKDMLDRLIGIRKDQTEGYDQAEVETMKARLEKGEKVVEGLKEKAEKAKTDYEGKRAGYDAKSRDAASIDERISLLYSLASKSKTEGVCSSCGQTLPEGNDHGHHEAERETAIRELEAKRSEINMEAEKETLISARDEAQAIINNFKNASEKLEGLKLELQEMDRKKPSDTIDAQIEEVNEEYVKLLGEKEDIDEVYADLLDIDRVLKSGVAKAPLISEYIPFFNLRVNEYLEKLGLPILLELDPSFKESVRSRFRQSFTYESFSAGQQARINFAIMMTWRDISKKLSSVDTNLLIIDEFGSRLDDEGVEAVSKCLLELEDTNTICIGPRELVGEFDRKIKIKTVSNFAVVEIKE
ncbi:recombination endonuclease subunit [Agrobacterium phage OLIVR5]|uniref:Recombination endonuclease subunit n=1 Tax=Agrobacterium phage OLIVR5 TaxID=2723773 RepID=A0A858MT04_9CAUD|nr:recombination endonuclease subunit [Agrobacterium phage OLIVR5]QIW87729.1 recombination endonuclease subunit [Agrobacterium phage OLIVR5]QIW87991.1 recombination endonuclease subunit [Agrobacterium phage OLIVR6]